MCFPTSFVLILVPWEWYHASRTLHLCSDVQDSVQMTNPRPENVTTTSTQGPTSSAVTSDDELETVNASSHQQTTGASESEAAIINLRRTELLALASCAAAPLIGGWLLHHIREFLSRPSEGLVSTFNITLFVMAAELRPAMKIMEMIKERSLHLQRIIHKEILETNVSRPSTDLEPLNEKIATLENAIEELRMSIMRVQGGREEVVAGVREGIRADVEALNRNSLRLVILIYRRSSSI